MNCNRLTESLSGHIDRAKFLLNKKDYISITYCALEMRKAIELVVWSQFYEAFFYKITKLCSLGYYDFMISSQSGSIPKMYALLKKYSPNYVSHAKNNIVLVYKSSYGDAPLKEDGKVCYIPGELPNSYYKYLSELIHYEKEFVPSGFKVDIFLLKKILKILEWLKDNYTLNIIPIIHNKEDEIIKDFIKDFNVKIKKEPEFRSN
ncbi:MAG: hypothetical protein HN600_06515 [Bacteroidetes bacterium]|jgi:hypothetical protein|nr:hypothetical protein [Bacteroidota bacterium]